MQVSYWVQCSRVGGTVDYCSRRKICVRSGPEILAMITIHCVLQASRPVSAAAVVLHVPCLLQQVPPPQISVVRETFSLLSCVAAHEVAVCLIWREKAIVLQVSPSRACQFFAQRLMCSVQLSFQFIFQLVIDASWVMSVDSVYFLTKCAGWMFWVAVCDRVLSELALFEQFTRGKYVKRSASVDGIRLSKPMEVVTIGLLLRWVVLDAEFGQQQLASSCWAVECSCCDWDAVVCVVFSGSGRSLGS